ncbi:ATP-grasp fold amidoligase family protein [Acinetobacter sp. YH12136]|uniref:ATP-grasp fold amidoligase family protein n=1 Tax=Acinetobacter sp. YH12136 TaxID=2601120 RepID=UPI0015D1E86C|nr:ATP-grasp fold amidoligase family protein [Acinetobacter sp. YH12136]
MKDFLKDFLRRNFPIFFLKLFYFKVTKKYLNIKNPKTFDEKIQWLKLYDLPENELAIKCADKFLLSSYLENKGLEGINAKLLGSWDTFDEIVFDSLPNKFVLKTNNASGTNFFCENKKDLNYLELKNTFNNWLKLDFGMLSLEKHYSKILPKIIAEEFLDFSEQNLEYNFYCFNGIVRFCKVVSFDNKETKKGLARCYDNDWKELDFDYPQNLLEPVKKPNDYDYMVNICADIAKDFKFIRVDFFQCNNRVVLGELTFSPAAGIARGFNDKAQETMGQWLDIQRLH